MLYFHKELKLNYQIAVKTHEYFKIENRLYSDIEFVNPLEIICKKYPDAIFASDSAYYYNLTNVISDYFYLATKRTDTRINNNIFKHNLSDARNNWLGVPVNEVINSVVVYFETLKTVKV